MEDKISIILPAYNELQNLRLLIPELVELMQGREYEIVVVDDNSADGTRSYLESQDNPALSWVIREHSRGFASAIAEGINQAKGDVIVIMDSDFNHRPTDILPMVEQLASSDFVSGSRFLKGGGSDYPCRTLFSRLFNCYVNASLKSNLTDHLFGLCVFRKRVLNHLDMSQVFYGFGEYYIRFIYYLQHSGVFIAECSAHHQRRRWGNGNKKLIKTFKAYLQCVKQLSSRAHKGLH